MNRSELTELLQELAQKDLDEGSDIYDHPCSVAIRAIDQCFEDIRVLKRVVGNNANNKSKRVQVLAKGMYCPSW